MFICEFQRFHKEALKGKSKCFEKELQFVSSNPSLDRERKANPGRSENRGFQNNSFALKFNLLVSSFQAIPL